MTVTRALLLIAFVVSASCIAIMLSAGRAGSLASRLALTEPAAGVLTPYHPSPVPVPNQKNAAPVSP